VTRGGRRRPVLVGAGVGLLVVVVTAVALAPWLAPFDPSEQLVGPRFAEPSRQHWLGTDRYGRDVASRLLFGGRETLALAGAVLVVLAGGGGAVGALVGAGGRWVDAVGQRVIDLAVSIPAVLVALAFVGLRGPSLATVVGGATLVWWAPFARLSCSVVRSALAQPSAIAARGLGAGRIELLRHEGWPRLRGPMLVLAAVEAGQLIAAIAGLSFLGFGAQPPSPEWGAMLEEGRAYLSTAPHLVYAPGVAVLVTVLALTCISEGMRDRLDRQAQVVVQ
jgi:ABC-type dipeptide/oligopeptide/nickel transport system permease subunit